MLNFYEFIEAFSGNLDIPNTVDVLMKNLPEQNDIINFKECFSMAHVMADKKANIDSLNEIVTMFASGYDANRMGPYENIKKVLYKEPIIGNILIMDNMKKKEIAKMRKAEISKARKLGYDISSFKEVDHVGNTNGIIVLNPKLCTCSVEIDENPRNNKTSMKMEIILLPHQYQAFDILALAGIIHHEARHLHDFVIQGYKQQYTDTSTLNEYYQSFSEARAFSDQIVQQFLIVKRVMSKSNEEVAQIIKDQIDMPESFMRKLMPDSQKDLFSAFIDAIVSNPKVLSSRIEMLSKSVVKENVLPEEIGKKAIDTIMVLWNKFYETIISPTNILRNIADSKGIDIDH